MTKKRILAALGLVAFVGIVLGVLAMLPPRAGVTKVNFEKIKSGMTVAEVEHIFGDRSGLKSQTDRGRSETWLNDDGSNASVWLSNERVIQKAWTESTETLPDKICRWLYLR